MPVSAPEDYSVALARAVGPFYTQGMAEDTAALREGVFNLEEYIAQSRIVAAEHLKILDNALDGFEGGLLFFHFFGIDQNSHTMWGRFEKPLLDTYRTVDGALGRVMRKFPDATIIVMSDHGFSSFDRAVHLNALLRQEGFLNLDDPANAGSDELFAHVEWQNTRAYALGLNALYLNLSGREQKGVVASADRDRILKKIAERLLAFRDPENDRRVVETVYFPREHFEGSLTGSAPDLVVGYAAGYRASWQTALGAVPATVVEVNREAWIGDHCIAAHLVPGVLISNRKSKIEGPQLKDFTSTLLNEFGVSPAERAAGRVLY
jgi:predicted AlkP superfamily phosphohydrolase/phosphomutase